MTSVPIRPLILFVALPVGLAFVFGASVMPLLAAYAAFLALVLWSGRRPTRKAGAKRFEPSAVAFLLFLFFGLPTALASVVAETWFAILIAYAIWFGLLGLWMAQGLLSRRVTNKEATGWPIIMGMFLTMVAVPILTLLLRLGGVA